VNAREYGRVTAITLPNKNDSSAEAIRKLTNSISILLKKDEDKEKRIRLLEDELKRATGRNSVEKMFGPRWKIVGDPEELQVLYNRFGRWVSAGSFTPPP
jgi:hypothetical protein